VFISLGLAVLGVAAAMQGPVTVDELRGLAASAQEQGRLAEAARERPDSIREAILRSFALASGPGTPAASAAELAAARRLGHAYARAWADSFLVREVARFERWGPEERRARVASDSLRRAGIEAYGREGAPAAMALWRRALGRASRSDPAGRAAALGSVGAGFYLMGRLDSAGVYLARSRDAAAEVGDVRTLGNAIGILASVTRDRGDLPGAVELYRRASRLRERSGDRRGLAADQNNLGLIARELGDLDAAERAFTRALDLNRRDERRRQVALNLANLADIASVRGAYAQADSLYREALTINRADGDVAETAFALRRLGLLGLRRGDYASARGLLVEALAVHEAAGAMAEAVEVRRDLALAEAATGDLQRALNTLRKAEQDARGLAEAPGVRAGLALTAADLSVQLGVYGDADAGYARAERLYREAADDVGRGRAQEGRALLLHLREDYDGALRLLQLAGRTHATGQDQRAAALTELLGGHVQRAAGNSEAARRSFERALGTLRDVGDAVGEAAALDALGGLEADRGASLAAEGLYRRALRTLGDRRADDVRWQLHAHLAAALKSRGALDEATDELRLAAGVLEQAAAGLRVEERRVGYLSDKWHVFASLALFEQERGRTAEAFSASERLRARQMRDLLARGQLSTRPLPSRREQDLRRRSAELMRIIESADSRPQSAREPGLERSADAARESLALVQEEYAALLLRLRESDPAYAELVTAETVHWRSVADALEPDEVFLEYLVTDSGSTVFVVTEDTLAAVDLGADRTALANLVEFARRTMDRPGDTPAGALWRTPLKRLFQYLVEPVEQTGLLAGKRRLVIAPHGELHFLHFGALLGSGPTDRFLIERFELRYAPSATVWVRLEGRESRPPLPGVLALAPRPEALPGSLQEVEAIRRIQGQAATVLVGEAASEQALRAAAPRHGVLHLATYGILNKHNPLFSFVELAPAGQDDGRLEVHEVYGLRLAGQLVVLSACQTALGSGAIGDVPAGDDWVGLVQAFLYAGAGSVLASLWPVEDRATAQLMRYFYLRRADGESETAALAGAQRDMLRETGTMHPSQWSGFVLVGGAGD